MISMKIRRKSFIEGLLVIERTNVINIRFTITAGIMSFIWFSALHSCAVVFCLAGSYFISSVNLWVVNIHSFVWSHQVRAHIIESAHQTAHVFSCKTVWIVAILFISTNIDIIVDVHVDIEIVILPPEIVIRLHKILRLSSWLVFLKKNTTIVVSTH